MKFRLSILCAAFVITACTQPVTITSQDARLDYLTNMQRWEVKGRVAIHTHTESHAASITWRQMIDGFDIFLSNPLASQSLHVTPENIDETYLYDLPAEHMRYWLKGMPSPHSAIKKASYNRQNLAVSLEQDGWTINYLSYSPYHPIMLPEKIVANKDEINIKIIINCWNK